MAQAMNPRGPLGHVELQILLNLASGPNHGYAMMQAISGASHGRLKAGPGTLYVALKRLVDSGLVMESDSDPQGSRARRNYQITENGLALLRAEIRTLSEIVERASATNWFLAT